MYKKANQFMQRSDFGSRAYGAEQFQIWTEISPLYGVRKVSEGHGRSRTIAATPSETVIASAMLRAGIRRI